MLSLSYPRIVFTRETLTSERRCVCISDGSVFWYVLFVRTGSEAKVTERLKLLLGDEGYRPFVPRKCCVFRRHGQKKQFYKTCFSGYVFIESDKPSFDFMRQVYPVVYTIKEANRFLCYGDKFDIAMRDEERLSLSKVLDSDDRIGISVGFREGDNVRIISGVLEGNESKIVRVNRNRHEATISLQMFGASVQVSVGLEVIEKATGRNSANDNRI